MAGVTHSMLTRFWVRVDQGADDECWPWIGGRMKKGYGVFWPRKGRPEGAHRVSWELHHRESIPRGMQVLHSCDNPPCVNPRHLWVGTCADNMRDKSEKGRNPGNRTNHGGTPPKWSPAVVIAMRAQGMTYRQIADQLDISPATALRTARR